MEGGDVDCRYEDAFERPWTAAMGGPDNSWAEPGLGSNPLNYTLAFCDIIGKLAMLYAKRPETVKLWRSFSFAEILLSSTPKNRVYHFRSKTFFAHFPAS